MKSQTYLLINLSINCYRISWSLVLIVLCIITSGSKRINCAELAQAYPFTGQISPPGH